MEEIGSRSLDSERYQNVKWIICTHTWVGVVQSKPRRTYLKHRLDEFFPKSLPDQKEPRYDAQMPGRPPIQPAPRLTKLSAHFSHAAGVGITWTRPLS